MFRSKQFGRTELRLLEMAWPCLSQHYHIISGAHVQVLAIITHCVHLFLYYFHFVIVIVLSDSLPLRQVHAEVAESVKDIFSRYKAQKAANGISGSCTSDSNDPWNDPCLKFGGFHKLIGFSNVL